MTISIDDLNGFDFSDKYLNIHETFTIEKDGIKVDFKIFKREGFNGYGEIWFEYGYYLNNSLMKRRAPYKNPFEIYRDVEKDIVKSDNIFNQKYFLIKNILGDFNPNFDKWDELTKKLTSNVNILKLHPNYKSSKIPQFSSKEELAEYLDKLSKYELESFFTDLSIVDFEIFYQNTWGEDYEYLIEKAFSTNIFGVNIFSRTIFDIINQKRKEYYVETILRSYGFEIDKNDIIVPMVYSIIDSMFNGNKLINQRYLRLRKLSERDKIYFNEDYFQNMEEINHIIENEFNNYKHQCPSQKTDFVNLTNSLSKYRYVKNLMKVSSDSKAQHIMRYKIPNDYGEVRLFQEAALNHGHVQIGNSKDNLSQYLVIDLRSVLNKYGLNTDGNKIHLINRIKENLSDEIVNKEFPKKYYSLTEKGHEYLDKYYYLAEFYSVIPPNFTLDEFDLICNLNPEVSPDDIIWCLVNEKWIVWDDKLGDEPKIKEENNKERLKIIFGNR